MVTAFEYLSGLAGGYFLGAVTDIPRLLFRPVVGSLDQIPSPARPLLQEISARCGRMHQKSFMWGKRYVLFGPLLRNSRTTAVTGLFRCHLIRNASESRGCFYLFSLYLFSFLPRSRSWAGISATLGGMRVACKVVRGGVEDEWNTVFSSMAAGAFFRRAGAYAEFIVARLGSSGSWRTFCLHIRL